MHPSIVSFLVEQPGIDFNAKHTVRDVIDPALQGATPCLICIALAQATTRIDCVQVGGSSMTPLGMAVNLQRAANEDIIKKKMRQMGIEVPTP